MKKYRMLVLTDHSTHSSENSMYALLRIMKQHPSCQRIDVASRGSRVNAPFFEQRRQSFYAVGVDDDFEYSLDEQRFTERKRRAVLGQYDVILIRLPHPVPSTFWDFLTEQYPEERIINRPSGIQQVGNKAYLLNFPQYCPPMRLCRSVEAIREFRDQFPIVLKPLQNYGGKGIVRIDGDRVWEGQEQTDFTTFVKGLSEASFPYLGMRYLKKVSEGDKRVVVCNGVIVGASLRLPAKDSWLCNASQGGKSVHTLLTPEEEEMAGVLAADLMQKGVVFFGFDTLVDDDGKRVLSEINAMSIGGLKQIEQQSGRPVLTHISDQLWNYINANIHGKIAHHIG